MEPIAISHGSRVSAASAWSEEEKAMTKICAVRSAAGEAGQRERGRGFSPFRRALGERRTGDDFVVRHSRGAVLVRHLRYVRRRGGARRPSQRQGGGGLDGESQI